MAYEIGTASGHKDLLLKLKTFVTTNPALVAAGQQWTILRDLTPADGEHELILRGPGLSNTEQIFVGIQTYTYAAGPAFNWRMNGYTGFDTGCDFTLQPGALPGPTNLPAMVLRDGLINYWFVANGRRIIIAVQAGTYYQQAYLGFLLPFGPSTFNSYPLFIGANSSEYKKNVGWFDMYRAESFWNPRLPYTYSMYGMGGSWFYSGGWRAVGNVAVGTQGTEAACTPGHAGPFLNVWPFACPSSYSSSEGGYAGIYLSAFRENLDGSMPILPLILFKTDFDPSTIPPGIYAMFDGVYASFYFSQSQCDTVVQDSRTFLLMLGMSSLSDKRVALLELK